jgi:hypothetical protein
VCLPNAISTLIASTGRAVAAQVGWREPRNDWLASTAPTDSSSCSRRSRRRFADRGLAVQRGRRAAPRRFRARRLEATRMSHTSACRTLSRSPCEALVHAHVHQSLRSRGPAAAQHCLRQRQTTAFHKAEAGAVGAPTGTRGPGMRRRSSTGERSRPERDTDEFGVNVNPNPSMTRSEPRDRPNGGDRSRRGRGAYAGNARAYAGNARAYAEGARDYAGNSWRVRFTSTPEFVSSRTGR